MTTVNNNNKTISLEELNEMSNYIKNKPVVLTGKQSRALKSKTLRDTTAEFFKNATFAPTAKSNKRRTEGFKIFADKEETAKRLEKTKICNNTLKYGYCKRKVCTFAHSLEELKDPPCAFGKTCRSNINCRFKHPDESRSAYHVRCNIVIPDPIFPHMNLNKPTDLVIDFDYDEIQDGILEEAVMTPLPKETYEEYLMNIVQSTTEIQHGILEEAVMRPLPKETYEEYLMNIVQSTTVEEMVIKVPYEIAEEAMLKAIESGMKNIRIEII